MREEDLVEFLLLLLQREEMVFLVETVEVR
jgi:hypothetical protein